MPQATPTRESSTQSDPAEPPGDLPRLHAIFGTGRSGSTWLGSILDSHPDVIYRLEPFHRLATDRRIQEAKRRILSEGFGPADVPAVYQALRPAFPEVSKPVFFPKNSGRTAGRQVCWKPAHLGPLRDLYAMLYTPPDGLPLVFKEVNLETMMDRLIQAAKTRVVYILRHPCAQVSSVSRGQESDLMAAGRLPALKGILRDFGSPQLHHFLDRIDELDVFQKNALLWRIDVDLAWDAVLDRPNVLTVVYENLCRDPLAWGRRVFDHFGIPFHDQTARFIRESTEAPVDPDLPRSRAKKVDYFNVFRNPEQSMNKWKTRLTPEAQDSIREIVAGSPAYEYGVQEAGWD
jgi:hypothetical protein